MSKYTVLTISEDRAFGAALAEGLRGAAVDVVSTGSGAEALKRSQEVLPELVVVDDYLSTDDPLETCRQMRGALGRRRSLVMIVPPPADRIAPERSGESGEDSADQARLLDLATLVRSIVALAGPPDRGSLPGAGINAQGLEMDRRRMRATVDRRELKFTPTEFRIMWTLARKPGIVFTRQQLCDACRDSDAPVQVRTIDVHIRTIRQKLGPRADLVETVRGVGYRFQDSSPLGAPRAGQGSESTLTGAEQVLS